MGIWLFSMQKEDFIAIAAIIIVLLFLGVMFLLTLFYFNNKKRRIIEEKRLLELEFNKELLKTKLEIQDETFRNISQEIHDNIGQTLSLLKLTIATAIPENIDQVTEALKNSKQMVIKTIQDIRNLAHSLNPDFIEQIGLPTAIKQQLELVDRTKKYEVVFDVKGEQIKYHSKKELVLFRVVQELINNIVKHAKANKISILMKYSESHLEISVADNGIGFDMNTLKTNKDIGIGLLNMNNRIKMIEGELNISSSIGEGTIASITI